jgi:hypothetical protein
VVRYGTPELEDEEEEEEEESNTGRVSGRDEAGRCVWVQVLLCESMFVWVYVCVGACGCVRVDVCIGKGEGKVGVMWWGVGWCGWVSGRGVCMLLGLKSY